MRIGLYPLRQILLAIVAPPHLRPAEEKALVAGRPVDHRRLLAAQRLFIGVVGDGQPREVADIFAEGEGAVEMLAGQHRSEEHTSELQSLMRISYAVFCLKKKKEKDSNTTEQAH